MEECIEKTGEEVGFLAKAQTSDPRTGSPFTAEFHHHVGQAFPSGNVGLRTAA